jgi:hypothetical protein
MKPLHLLLALSGLGLSLFLVGCATSDDDNSIPWSQPQGWENNKLPAAMPNYGDRQY